MIDDIEGDIGAESTADTGGGEAELDPSDELSSDIRDAIDGQRERGPDGKFVSSRAAKGKPDAQVSRGAQGIATGAANSAAPANRADRTAGASKAGDSGERSGDGAAVEGVRPPPGYSVASKQAWDALPETVKADIAKREADIEAGTKRYTGLSRFAEEAERNGTTLQSAVADYDAVEKALRKDPVDGVEFLFRKMNLNPLGVLKAWLSRYVPAQGGNGQVQPQPQAAQQQIDPNAIANHAVNVVRQEMQMRQYESDIAAFSAVPANKFFANVRMDMAHLVQIGKATDLQQAYEAACWLNPEIRAIMLEETAAGRNKAAVNTAVRAQNAAKAVTGAPSNSHAGDAPRRRDLSLEDEVRANVNAQRGTA